MRKFKDLTEAKETAAFTIGRFNPPTIGHEKVITTLVKKSSGNSFYVFLLILKTLLEIPFLMH